MNTKTAEAKIIFLHKMPIAISIQPIGLVDSFLAEQFRDAVLEAQSKITNGPTDNNRKQEEGRGANIGI